MGKKIFLAEDDPDLRLILTLVLHEAGYEIEASPSGLKIFEKNRDEWPDLFILDKGLPTADGIAISKYLKVREETKDIPIIMISCYHELKAKARRTGVNDFLEKPFDLKVLLQVVKKNMAIDLVHDKA